MPKRTWRWDKEAGELVEVFKPQRPPVETYIQGDIESFVSPIDGSVISDRSHLRAHNKRHGVTNVADYGPDWFGRKRKEREAVLNGTTTEAKRSRRAALIAECKRRGI